MHVRTFRFQSKNPIVVIALLSIVVAVLVFFLSTLLAVGVGAALLGGVGYGVRRLLGGRPHLGGAARDALPSLDPALEVFPDSSGPAALLPREGPDATALKQPSVEDEPTDGRR